MLARLVLCTLASIGALLGPAGAVHARDDMIWGVNGHPLVSYPGIPFAQQIDFIAGLGLSSYRVDIRDARAGDALDRLVTLGKPRGIEILPVITPTFDLDRLSASELYTRSFELAVSLATRFGSEIRVWELGNEMENYAIIQPCELRDNGVQYDCKWGPAGGVDPLDYFGPRWAKSSAVLKGLSDGFISVDPMIRKAMGTAGWGHVGAFERMQRDGIRWDISVWHMYGQDPEWAFKTLATYGKPIWVTELNHPEGSKNGEADQANGLRRWIDRLRELAPRYRVEAVHIYELMDEPQWQPSYEAYMGLVTVDKTDRGGWRPGRPKAAYEAVRAAVGRAQPPVAMAREQPAKVLFDDNWPAFVTDRSRCNLQAFHPRDDRALKYQIAYAYCLVFGRKPDNIGRETWARALARDGHSAVDLVAAMIGSGEFADRNRQAVSTDSGFVVALYGLLLDRKPDRDGFVSYATRLQQGSMTRETLVREFLEAPEFRSKHPILAPDTPARALTTQAPHSADAWRRCDVRALSRAAPSTANKVALSYCLILGRPADSLGHQAYVAGMDRGMTIVEVCSALAGSDEFEDKLRVVGPDQSRFVDFVYLLLFDTKPDERTRKKRTAELESGAISRIDLTRELLASKEFARSRPALFEKG